jgi:biotin carboxyl carrier protein
MSKAQVISPLPGTFYRKPAPASPPFKQDGDPVTAADVVGLVELMKNFEEITAAAEGKAITFLVEDGEAIMAGQAIAEIEV